MDIPKLKFEANTITLGNIFRISWNFFREHFRAIVIILATVYIPVDIVIFFLNNAPEISLKEYIKIMGYLEQFIGIIATLAIALYITGRIENQNISIKESLEQGLKSWGKVVLTNVVTSIMIGLLTLLLIVPGIIYGVYWVFITYIVLFLGKTGENARNHSKLLVDGRWWKTFGLFTVMFLIPLILGFLVSFIYYLVLGLYFIDFDTLSLAGNFVVDMISNFAIDILGGYFTICGFITFVAYESVYGPQITETTKKAPVEKKHTTHTSKSEL